MTPKEKANYLIYKMKYSDGRFSKSVNKNYKQCSLVCVDEIIIDCGENLSNYWKEVKQEINKL